MTLILRQVFFQERKGFLPAVHGLFLPVVGSVIVEKSMTRFGVHMKFVVLAKLFELFFMGFDLLGSGAGIFLAK